MSFEPNEHELNPTIEGKHLKVKHARNFTSAEENVYTNNALYQFTDNHIRIYWLVVCLR